MDSRELIWDEYKYSYQLVWDTVFKLTGAVVLVSIVPYTNREVACVLGWLAVAPPAVASGLALFGHVCIKREVETWALIRAEHRKTQNLNQSKTETFSKHVNWFLSLLVVAAISNAIIVLSIWRPAVAPIQGAEPSSCFSTPSSPSEKSAPSQESAPQR